jgi:hypothetical protein
MTDNPTTTILQPMANDMCIRCRHSIKINTEYRCRPDWSVSRDDAPQCKDINECDKHSLIPLANVRRTKRIQEPVRVFNRKVT